MKRRGSSGRVRPVPAHPVNRRRAHRIPTQAGIRRSRSRTLIVLYALLCLEVSIAGLTSPLLAVRREIVTGIAGLTPIEQATVLRSAAVQPGTNWLRVRTSAIAKRIVALPWVRSATVGRRLGSAIGVNIVPRIPLLCVLVNGQQYEVDSGGVPIRLLRPEMEGRMPLVQLDRPRPVVPGVALRDPAIDAARSTYRANPGRTVSIAKIEVDQNDNICLNMLDGVRVLFGQCDTLTEKIGQLAKIYERRPDIGRELSAINLISPAFPACVRRNADATDKPPGSETTTSAPDGTEVEHASVVPAEPGSRSDIKP